jgi:hypothetical protein
MLPTWRLCIKFLVATVKLLMQISCAFYTTCYFILLFRHVIVDLAYFYIRIKVKIL